MVRRRGPTGAKRRHAQGEYGPKLGYCLAAYPPKGGCVQMRGLVMSLALEPVDRGGGCLRILYMPPLLRFACFCALALLATIPPLAASEPPHAAAYVQVRGREFITPSGEVLRLRGTNLGNWLLPEGYMWEFNNANSPRLIEDVIAE